MRRSSGISVTVGGQMGIASVELSFSPFVPSYYWYSWYWFSPGGWGRTSHIH
jgi:hypothetical protein